MILGVDFDNTIVCYDGLFHRAAVERGLVPESLPESKGAVRDHLRRTGRESLWTELQGYVYGPGMAAAQPYAGVLDFFRWCVDRELPVYIISHRTRRPFLGPSYDLHASAREWLAERGFHDRGRVGLAHDRVFFEETKGEKLARIAAVGCSEFIDDLPELLGSADFPPAVRKILFDPNHDAADCPGAWRVHSWSAISDRLLRDAA